MNRFREWREARGFSQKFVAVSLGVKAPSVSDWESGKTNPTLDNLIALSKLLGVTCDQLLTDDTPPPAIGSSDALTPDEQRLIGDYRSLNEQGQAYIRQTMYMALLIYKRHSDLPDVADEKISG